MKEQLALVLALHEVDMKIQAREEAVAKIGPDLEQQEELVNGHRKTLEGKTAKIAELEKLRRSKEGEVEISESRLKDFQGKLSQIKTNKEYQAALKEMADTKKINKGIEDQILEIMTQLEGLKGENKAIEEVYQGAAVVFDKKKQDLMVESERLRGEIGAFIVEREKVAAQIDAAVMVQYQRIRKVGREAISQVTGGICQGCHMRIPPQLYIEIQKLKVIHVCPTCQRILYLAEAQGGQLDQGNLKEVSS